MSQSPSIINICLCQHRFGFDNFSSFLSISNMIFLNGVLGISGNNEWANDYLLQIRHISFYFCSFSKTILCMNEVHHFVSGRCLSVVFMFGLLDTDSVTCPLRQWPNKMKGVFVIGLANERIFIISRCLCTLKTLNIERAYLEFFVHF